MRAEVLTTGVETTPYDDGASSGAVSSETLARRARETAAERAGEVLAHRAETAGLARATVRRARAHWAHRAWEDIGRWHAKIAAHAAWLGALDAVRRLGAHAPERLPIARWALVAEGGAALAGKLAKAEPWVAMQAVHHLDSTDLAQAPDTWRDALERLEREWGVTTGATAHPIGAGTLA